MFIAAVAMVTKGGYGKGMYDAEKVEMDGCMVGGEGDRFICLACVMR